jgi:hypothetical protein
MLGMRHWNVSFEPIRSVFIGSVHDRITEVVGIGPGGFICCGFACLVLVRRRLHRRSFATLKDKGNFKRASFSRVQALQLSEQTQQTQDAFLRKHNAVNHQ